MAMFQVRVFLILARLRQFGGCSILAHLSAQEESAMFDPVRLPNDASQSVALAYVLLAKGAAPI